MSVTSREIFLRIFYSVLAGFLLAIVITEGSYFFNKEKTARSPKVIELVIPAGTAELIAAGQEINSIPEEMFFVQGDTLVVVNEDVASHQLGPIWVPPGARGSLVLDEANQYSYSCSFQATRYVDLDVYPQLSWGTRLNGILMMALPSIPLIAVYSIVMFPGKRKDPVQDQPKEIG